MYITWYGFGRMFIEGLRTDSLYFMKSVFGETIRISQVVGALSFVVGTVLLIVFGIRARKKKAAEGEYEPVYNIGKEKTEDTVETESEEDGNGKDN